VTKLSLVQPAHAVATQTTAIARSIANLLLIFSSFCLFVVPDSQKELPRRHRRQCKLQIADCKLRGVFSWLVLGIGNLLSVSAASGAARLMAAFRITELNHPPALRPKRSF
jgi:hypothetical protein